MNLYELKALFENGDTPTGEDYATLIDAIFEGQDNIQTELVTFQGIFLTSINDTKAELQEGLNSAANSITALEERISNFESDLATANSAIAALEERIANLENPAK